MTGLEVALAGLAVYRWARLVAVDEITRPARDAVGRWASGAGAGDPDLTWRGRVAFLLGCPYCVGVWATVPVLAVSAHAPGSLGWWAVVGGPAVAGLAALASTFDS